MPVSAIGNVRDLIEIAVTAMSVMGGVMAYSSGSAALGSVLAGEAPELLGEKVNRGLAWGFMIGLPTGTVTSILLLI